MWCEVNTNTPTTNHNYSRLLLPPVDLRQIFIQHFNHLECNLKEKIFRLLFMSVMTPNSISPFKRQIKQTVPD